MRFKFLSTLPAIAVSLALACPAAVAGEPIPGVDIYLGKDGIAIIIPTDSRDAFGRFSLRLTEPGNYTLSTACRQECPAHTITATYQGDASFARAPGTNEAGPAPTIAILIGLLLPAVQHSSVAPATTSFNVGNRGVVVSGQLPSAEGTYYVGTANGGVWKTLTEINEQSIGTLPGQIRGAAGDSVAVGDFNLDGREETIVRSASTGGDGRSAGTSRDLFMKSPAVAPKSGDAKPAGTTDVFGQAVTFTATVIPGSPGAGTPTGSVTFRNSEGFKISDSESPRPTDRIALRPGNQDDKPGISNPEFAANLSNRITAISVDPSDADALYLKIKMQDLLVSSIASSPKNEDGKLPGISGNPVLGTGARFEVVGDSLRGIEVSLVGDPGEIKIKGSAKTDQQGAFQFTKLPAGKYNIFITGQPARAVMVGTNGTLNGNLTRGSDGNISFSFGSIGAGSVNTADGFRTGLAIDKINNAKNPVTGFGSGNTSGFGAGFGGAPGSGMSPIGGINPGNPIGAGGAMGGAMNPGGAMGGAKR